MDRQTGQKLYAPDLSMWGHKKIYPCQPVHDVQADTGQQHLLLVNFFYVTGSIYPIVQFAVRQNRYYGPMIKGCPA